jgi:putative ABC transport system permease protein
VNHLLRRSSVRFYWRHPWQLVLAVAGISLGVAVYVGVDLANGSAERAFELSAALVRGQATHRLLPVGGDLDEATYRDIVAVRGIAAAAPVLELDVGIAGRPGVRYPLLGIDPLQEAAVRDFTSYIPGRGTDFARLITEPGTVLLPSALADELRLAKDETVLLTVRGREVRVRMLGTVAAASQDAETEPPLVADIATAQELAGRTGTISRIDLKLTAREAEDLARDVPPGTVLVPAESDNRAFTELAAAFRTNLRALGLLALVVGMFLIYGTMSFAIVQRRATLGVLRAIGLTRREVLGTVLLEALALGLIATVIGLVLGHVLAMRLVDLVLRTIGDLYFTSTITAVPPSADIYVRGAVLGIAGTLLAGAKPALDAARSAPAAVMRRAELERGTQRAAWLAAWTALPLLAASLLLLAFGSRSLLFAFGGLFGVLAGCALLVPQATLLSMRALERGVGRFLPLSGLLAVRGVGASLSRTGVATAALAIAVATVNGVGLMITSFRTSLADWLGTTLTADLYVGFDGNGTALTDAELARIEALSGVAGVSLTRMVLIPTPAGELAVRALRPGPKGFGLEIVDGEPADALAAVADGRGLVASERYAFARNLSVGDALELPTPTGIERLPIVGTFRDFNTGDYSVAVALDWYRTRWGDDSLTGIGIHVEDGAERSLQDIETAVRAELPAPVRIRSTEGIRQVSLEIFDRTFQITEVLRLLAALVAFLGVLSALLSIELERAHELAVLRSLGFSPRELTATLIAQTGLLGAAAGLAAVPIGTGLAVLLVHVINRRAFGWSMDFVLTPAPLVSGFALAVGAALLAGIYPAVRASRIGLGGALREE